MNFHSDTNVVEVAVRRLRAKIDDNYILKLIYHARHGLCHGTEGFKRMAQRSITFRLSILFALIASLILLAVGWQLFYALVEHFEQQDRAELAVKVELICHMLSELKNEAEIPGDVHRFRDAVGRSQYASSVAFQQGRQHDLWDVRL